MAQSAFLTDQQVLGQEPEVADLSRQRKIAELLMAQGMEQPTGQVISGHYVAPSWTQQLAPLAKAAIGTSLSQSLDEKQAKLAEALRTKGIEETKKIVELYKTDPAAALTLASNAQTPQGRAFAQTLMQNQLPKKTEKLIEYDTYKAEGGKLPFSEWINRLTPEQEARLAIDRQRLGLEGARLNLEQAKAAQELAFGKPLPEGAIKQVTGATNLKDAISGYQQKLKNFSTVDFANPNARAEMSNAYNNMMLQAKEAYNLGVLNGPDYNILTSIVTDPTSPKALLVKKDTLNKQADELSGIANNIIKNVYTTHNRPVPQLNQQMMPQASQAPKKVVNFNDLP